MARMSSWNFHKFTVFALVLPISIIRAADFFSSECPRWTLENPHICAKYSFMWLVCPKSCVDNSKDTHEKCSEWAKSGECGTNPNFMQLQCASSCGYAIAWNPFVREDVLPILSGDLLESLALYSEGCKEPNPNLFQSSNRGDLLFIAETTRIRLKRYTSGEFDAIQSFDLLFYDPLMSFIGIGEMHLYVMRLYEIIAKHKKNQGESNWIAQQINNIAVTIASLDEDLLSRSVLSWQRTLAEASSRVFQTVLNLKSPNSYCQSPSSGLDVNKLLEVYFPRCSATGECSDKQAMQFGGSFLMNQDGLPKYPEDPPSPGMTAPKQRRLSNGLEIPVLGIGTFNVNPFEISPMIISGVSLGYRLIDIADDFADTDAIISETLHDLFSADVVSRGELFISIKAVDAEITGNAGFTGIQKYVRNRIKALGLGYVDLLLLDGPFQDIFLEQETWRGMEALYEMGLVKSLGLGNFASDMLASVVEYATVPPVVVQNKLDPFHIGKFVDPIGDNIFQTASELDVQVIGYAPLSGYPFFAKPVYDPVVQYIASRHSSANTSAAHLDEIALDSVAGESFQSNNYRKSAGGSALNKKPQQVTPLQKKAKEMLKKDTHSNNNNNNKLAGRNSIRSTSPTFSPSSPPGSDERAGGKDKGESKRDTGLEIPWDALPDAQVFVTGAVAGSQLTDKTIGVTPAQILIRFGIEKKAVMLTRSFSEDRLREAMAVLSMSPLTAKETKLLETLQHLVSSPVVLPMPAKNDDGNIF